MIANKIVAQFKRELWENKVSFVWAPLVFIILLLGASCWVVSNQNFIITSVESISEAGGDASQEKKYFPINLAADGKMSFLTSNYQAFSCRLYILAFMVVIAVYAHSTLFSDRKSREILFWRSMPVSETTNVLVKLAMVCVVVPIIIFISTLGWALLFLLILGLMNPDVGNIC